MTQSIPYLRNSRVSSLIYLRPMHPFYAALTTRLGNIAEIVLASDKDEVAQVERRARRHVRRQNPRSSQPGRPSLFGVVSPIIRDAIEGGA